MRTEPKASFRTVQYEYLYRYTPNIYIYIYITFFNQLLFLFSINLLHEHLDF